MWTITPTNNEYGLQVSTPGVTDKVSEEVQAAIDYSAGSSAANTANRRAHRWRCRTLTGTKAEATEAAIQTEELN